MSLEILWSLLGGTIALWLTIMLTLSFNTNDDESENFFKSVSIAAIVFYVVLFFYGFIWFCKDSYNEAHAKNSIRAER